MLDYEQDQAPHEKSIIRSCLLSGRDYPKAIANAPILQQENLFCYIAYSILMSCRNYEYGPIPYNYIKEYCNSYELDADQTERIINVIREVDVKMRSKEIARINKGARSNG